MLKPGSYAFRAGGEDLPYMTLDSLGWTTDAAHGYGNDGLTRHDRGHAIFQYTLSGEGRIDIGGQTWALPAGSGFLVRVPSEHRYYYPPEGTQPWAFLWLNARGEDALRMWDRMIEKHGPVVRLSAGAQPIEQFWELYRDVSVERLSDSAELSARLYRWMLSFFRRDTNYTSTDAGMHPVIRQAKRFMIDNFARPITLEDIAAHCGVSRSYLCRLFQKKENDSPLAYLQRRRVEAAVTMLRRTDASIQSIGVQCGFDSPSYFGKVFRRYLNLAPGEYRRRTIEYPYDTVYLD
ncbi:AraC family transcriptional regulator [Cohnella hongkongensis]|uniref:Helix-turn-helix domain-containing protein n=1 Tax=Cohnella hongkongensis TaxID=178337 RepID=A0ABV9FGB6_9BACL